MEYKSITGIREEKGKIQLLDVDLEYNMNDNKIEHLYKEFLENFSQNHFVAINSILKRIVQYIHKDTENINCRPVLILIIQKLIYYYHQEIDLHFLIHLFEITTFMSNDNDVFSEDVNICFLVDILTQKENEIDQNIAIHTFSTLCNILNDSHLARINFIQKVNIIDFANTIFSYSNNELNSKVYTLLVSLLKDDEINPKLFSDFFYQIMEKSNFTNLPTEFIWFINVYIRRIKDNTDEIQHIINSLILKIDFKLLFSSFCDFNDERFHSIIVLLQFLINQTQDNFILNNKIMIEFQPLIQAFQKSSKSYEIKKVLCEFIISYIYSPSFNCFSSFSQIVELIYPFSNESFLTSKIAFRVFQTLLFKCQSESLSNELNDTLIMNMLINTDLMNFFIRIINDSDSIELINDSFDLLISIMNSLMNNTNIENILIFIEPIGELLQEIHEDEEFRRKLHTQLNEYNIEQGNHDDKIEVLQQIYLQLTQKL
ncbi:hypothetical protein TRFO_02662 [Tritrichomonas foetus]|uniref:Uncharacterized protein n=1 Tax=Tritrichomonas foetus TaxID=1144522 RepID=A0A1J4KYT7_9EUKA|nr:hypothetical protein TRFO_02662 [Tritrichomonas foetus]|eukprot:OHT16415.1 hypothetical protein TRFO_02662 [Tritrichomonas foetus]